MPYSIELVVDNIPHVFAELSEPMIDGYRILSKDGSELEEDHLGFVTVPVLGGGGFGAVIRAKNAVGLDRALKIIDLGVIPDEAGATNMLMQEITLASSRPFQHTLPIFDVAEHKDMRGVTFGYYVMPFLEGEQINKFFSRLLTHHAETIQRSTEPRNLLRDLLLSIINQAISGICELHDSNVVHMDISAANLMISLGDYDQSTDLRELLSHARTFIIDLGAAKKISPNKTGNTIFIHHKYFFPNEIANPADLGLGLHNGIRHIRYEKLKKYWRLIDLYCFARTVEVIVLDRSRRKTPTLHNSAEASPHEHAKEELWKMILGDDFLHIEMIVDRLLQIRDPQYHKASVVAEVFATIKSSQASAVHDSVLLTDKYPGIRIKAGRQLVKLAPPLDRVVSHPTFQRLKRLNQLGLINEVFPGGTHSRFTHSLQTFHLMKRFIFALGRTTAFKFEFARSSIDDLLCAGLLHDLGQYPFSHIIEDLRKLGDLCMSRVSADSEASSAISANRLLPLCAVKHDQELAIRWIDKPDKSGVSISMILQDSGISLENVRYLILKDSPDPNASRALNIGRDITAGVLDADRLSYLQYDSEQTGVPYGTAIDVDSLIEGLSLYTDSKRGGLAIEEGAVPAAEALVAAVYWMYQNVYWHHTNRAFMATVKFCMRRLLESGERTFDEYAEATYGLSDYEALSLLGNWYSALTGDKANGVTRVSPLSSLREFERVGYRRVVSFAHRTEPLYSLEERSGTGNSIFEAMVRGIDPQREDELLKALRGGLCGKNIEFLDGDILLDVPLKPRLRWTTTADTDNSATPAEISDRLAKLWVKRRSALTKDVVDCIPFREYSAIARTFGGAEDTAARKVRIFISREAEGRLDFRSQEALEGKAKGIVEEFVLNWS